MAHVMGTGIAIGEEAPTSELRDTEGEVHSIGKPGAASVVVWTCNHCPYALAWHERIMQVARDYAAAGVRFHAVNSNDPERYPADSYDAMKERVAEEEWAMPYLWDDSQEAARAWGAAKTPDIFVLDAEGRLRYRGAPDADYDDPSQDAVWMRDAIDAVLAGEKPSRPETEPVGCSIKWRST